MTSTLLCLLTYSLISTSPLSPFITNIITCRRCPTACYLKRTLQPPQQRTQQPEQLELKCALPALFGSCAGQISFMCRASLLSTSCHSQPARVRAHVYAALPCGSRATLMQPSRRRSNMSYAARTPVSSARAMRCVNTRVTSAGHACGPSRAPGSACMAAEVQARPDGASAVTAGAEPGAVFACREPPKRAHSHVLLYSGKATRLH